MKLDTDIVLMKFMMSVVVEEKSAEKKEKKRETKTETQEEKKNGKDEKILSEEKNSTSVVLPCIDKLRDELSCAV